MSMSARGRLWVLALAALSGAAVLHGWLAKPPPVTSPTTGRDDKPVPPLVTFTTITLGGFRGVLADVLWVRAIGLQDEGRFFELVQLADWITRLEPRFPQVWGFHAWNLAYNISVMFPDAPDRWRWVQRGIRLIQDDGLRFNPDEPRLYRELAWLYLNKVGGRWDEAGPYYRRRLADAVRGTFSAADVPTAPASERAGWLTLDPDAMRDLTAKYGPVDWQAPETHALYWLDQGLRRAGSPPPTLYDHLLGYILVESVRQGAVLYVPEAVLYVRGPRFDLLDRTLAAYAEMCRTQSDPSFRDAYRNCYDGSIALLASHGRRDEARRRFDERIRTFPERPVRTDFDTFVLEQRQTLGQGLSLESRVQRVTDACFGAAAWRWSGNMEQASGFENLAALCYAELQAAAGDRVADYPPLETFRASAEGELQTALSRSGVAPERR